jgi:hypothetical protein
MEEVVVDVRVKQVEVVLEEMVHFDVRQVVEVEVVVVDVLL